jgi:L-amino acid N-acyltransferase YncA
MPVGPRIVPMTAAHADAVLAIYAEGIATGDATFETTVPAWEAFDPARRPDCRIVALDAAEASRVLGWAALSPVSTRPAYAGVAEVGVYVAASARGRGVGRALLAALIEASEAARVWTLQAGIFPENTASVRLHESLGFRLVGRRERIGRRDGRWRDTLLLERRSAVTGTD